MRQGSCRTSGVSTKVIPPLRWVGWPMCSMSISPLACVGAANKRGAAAKPAPKPKVFLRKSRLFFMARPLQELRDPDVRTNLHGHWIEERCTARQSNQAAALGASRGRSENSNAKDGERRSTGVGENGRTAVQPPCAGEIRDERVGRSIQDYGDGLNHSHLRNNLPRNVKTFRSDTVCLARMRHHYQIHDLRRWRIHGGMVVNHSRHRI